MTEVPIDDLPSAMWTNMRKWLFLSCGTPSSTTWYVSRDCDRIGNEHFTLYLNDELALLFALRWL